MTTADLLGDAFNRIADDASDIVTDLTPEQLAQRPNGRGNSIAWLIWHLTRVQDDHVSELAQLEQSWIDDHWHERFHLDLDRADTGFGHTSEQVSLVAADASLLSGYLQDVTARTKLYLASLGDADYPRIIDEAWDPPVTLGVRLVSVVNDATQHVGQAAYVRGFLLS